MYVRKGKKMRDSKRNRYSKDFKFKVAIEAVKAEKTLTELASEYKVHANMISTWKRQLLEHGSQVFDSGRSANEQDREEASERLVKTIGKQQIQIDWLKKKLGISDMWSGGL